MNFNCIVIPTKCIYFSKKMVFSAEDHVLKNSLSRKRLRQLMNNHTDSLEITVNVHESVLSRKLVFWTSN